MIDVHEDLEESNEDFTNEKSINVLRRLKAEREFNKRINRIRYIQTRNRFSHGDLAYVGYFRIGLLPTTDSEHADYGTDIYDDSLETVAYVHLLKTLRFIKAFTDMHP